MCSIEHPFEQLPQGVTVAATSLSPQHISPLRLTRRGRALITTLAVLALILLGFMRGGAAFGQSAPSAPVRVIVQQGDTLWSIAKAMDPEADPRAGVSAIRALNELSPAAHLIPGQALLLPSES
jgi:hypothetical protein